MGNVNSAVDSVAVPHLTSRISIAHTIVGEPRTFANAAAHLSLLVNGVQAAALGGRGGRLHDVFIRFTTMPYNATPELSKAVALLRPVAIYSGSLRATCSHPRARERLACCGKLSSHGVETTYPAGALQYFWLREAFRMVKRYEKEHRFEYTWVTRLRPDVVLLEPLPALRLLPPQRIYLQMTERGEIWDIIMLIPRSLLDPLSSALIDAFQTKASCMFESSPERLLRKQLLAKAWARANKRKAGDLPQQSSDPNIPVGRPGIPFSVHPFAATILREYNILDCHRFASKASEAEGTRMDHDGFEHHRRNVKVHPMPLTAMNSSWGYEKRPNSTDKTEESVWSHWHYCSHLQGRLQLGLSILPNVSEALEEYKAAPRAAKEEPEMMDDKLSKRMRRQVVAGMPQELAEKYVSETFGPLVGLNDKGPG